MHGHSARVARDIIRLCHAGLDSRALRYEVLRALEKIVPLDVAFFAATDPATLLFTGVVTHEILERATPQFLQNEFFDDDANSFRDLARQHRSVGSLIGATRGDPERSPRYREILAPLALRDELRAALVVDSCCWGVMCLHRERASPPFTADEAAFLAYLAPHIGEGLRAALLVGAAQYASPAEGPGVLVLEDSLALVASTPSAQQWLAQIHDCGISPERELPSVVYAVAARLKALELEHSAFPNVIPRVRLRTASGQWIVLHASRLRAADGPGRLAVVIEEARPSEIAPLIVQAYNLSRRESEITQLVLRGMSTIEITEQLHISSNTVQDHLKSIFDKVGVRSRRELTARLFAQQYGPRLKVGTPVGADGWFGGD